MRRLLCLSLLLAACARPQPAALSAEMVNPPQVTVHGKFVADVRTQLAASMHALGYELVISQPYTMSFQKRIDSVRLSLEYGVGAAYLVTMMVAPLPAGVQISANTQIVTRSGGVAAMPDDEIHAVRDALTKLAAQ